MALPVIADVYRVTMNFSSYNGITPHNVFHVYSASTNKLDLATAIDNSSNLDMVRCISSGHTWESVDVLPLDGTSTTLNFPLTTPWAGGAAGNMTPAVAGVLSLHTDQRGPRGRGRLYLGPCGEDDIQNGLLDATPVNDTVAGWLTFGTNLFGQTPPAVLCVASYTHADYNIMTSLFMGRVCGTVSRRQNQLR